MKFSQIFKEALLEAKKEKPSAGLTKKQKSDVAKKAKKGGDIGKKGKGFEKIAAKAAKQYGSEEKGKKVAAAAMWKNIKREEGIHEAFDPESVKAIATALWMAYKTAWGIKALNNHRPSMDAMKAAGDDKDRQWDVFKKYAMHLIDPTKNVFKTVDFSKKTNKPSLDIENPISEGEDHEVSMAQNSLKSIMQSCADLMNKLGDEERNIPGWIQDHISNAENFIDQAAQGFHELGHHEEEEDEKEGPDDDMGMIEPVDEKKLTKAEKAKKEDIIKAIAKKKGGKEKLKGKEYAIATAQAIKSAE